MFGLHLIFLFQLLANEIRVEQNTLLQCIRYIVKNNFFHNEATSRRDTTVKDPVNGEEMLTGGNKVGAEDTAAVEQGTEDTAAMKQGEQNRAVEQGEKRTIYT